MIMNRIELYKKKYSPRYLRMFIGAKVESAERRDSDECFSGTLCCLAQDCKVQCVFQQLEQFSRYLDSCEFWNMSTFCKMSQLRYMEQYIHVYVNILIYNLIDLIV